MPTLYLKTNFEIKGTCAKVPRKNLMEYFDDGQLSLNVAKKDESLGGAGVQLRLNNEKLVQGEIRIENSKKDVVIDVSAVFKISVRSNYFQLFQDVDVPFLFDGVEWSDDSLDKEISGLEHFDQIEKRRDGEITVRYYIIPIEVSAKKMKI